MAFKRILAISTIVAASSLMINIAWGNSFIADNPIIASHKGDDHSFVGIGHPITNDKYGAQGRDQFSDMVDLLEQQGYIKEKSDKLEGARIYEKTDEFWYCIKIDTCGEYYWIGTRGGEVATVKLVGKRNGEGHLEVKISNQ